MMKLTHKEQCIYHGISESSKLHKKELEMILTNHMKDKYEFNEYEDMLYNIISFIPIKYYSSTALVNKNYAKIIKEYKPSFLYRVIDLLPIQCWCILRKTNKYYAKKIRNRKFSPWLY